MLFNGTTNRWIKLAYIQGLDCETITFKICKHVRCTEKFETIYEGVVKPVYKKLLEQMLIMLVISIR